jgi:hypothetical protein
MEQKIQNQTNINKLAKQIKPILDHYSYVLKSEFNFKTFSFFDYYLYQKQVEVFKDAIKKDTRIQIIQAITRKEKRYLRWLRRILLSGAMLAFSYFFMHIPNALACDILKNKVVMRSIWDAFLNYKETKKEEKSSYVSRKILIGGGVILTLAIGAILFHQTGISRKLFTPKLKEIPSTLPTFNDYLPDIEILKKINFDENVSMRRAMFNQIVKTFGKENFYALLNGQLNINSVNNQEVFTVLTRLLKQALQLTRYESFVKGIPNVEKYVNASNIEDLTEMKEIVIRGLNRVIMHYPRRLEGFKDILTEALKAVESGKSFTFTKDTEKLVVNELLAHYLYQNMRDGVRPYYMWEVIKEKIAENK